MRTITLFVLLAVPVRAIGPLPDDVKGVPVDDAGHEPACGEVDYSSLVPPVRDQGQVGWCYAYAAADLLSFKLGQRISALDTALTFIHANKRSFDAARTPETSREGGHIAAAIHAALDKGLCLDDDVPSDMSFSMSLGHEIEDVDAKAHLARLEKRVVEYVKANPRGGNTGMLAVDLGINVANLLLLKEAGVCTAEFKTSVVGIEKIQRLHANTVCLETYHNAKLRFPGLTRQQYYDALLITTDRSILKNLADKACRKRFKPSPPPRVGETRPSPQPGRTHGDEAIARLDAALNGGQIAGISYDWAVVTTQLKRFKYGYTNHASSVVARRPNPETGACEYRLRNSWGVTCVDNSQYPCRQGNYWVPRAALQAGVGIVTTLAD